jgi:outer membrane protein OmpA-like peptidoglycan-associated protein
MSNTTQSIFGSPIHKGETNENGEHWLSISDLMAGLMMVFLFVSIALMREAFTERDKIKEIAVTYQENQAALYQALMTEFEIDLEAWGAEVEKETLSFNFKSPEVLFSTGEIALKTAFMAILDDFFPRYLLVLKKFDGSIDEVRIEGHTSSVWNHKTTEDKAYFNNMWLSQGRTRSVLEYVYGLPASESERPWIKKHLAAVGFSSARLVTNEDGTENRERSRRVSFRVVTNAETQIRKILEN